MEEDGFTLVTNKKRNHKKSNSKNVKILKNSNNKLLIEMPHNLDEIITKYTMQLKDHSILKRLQGLNLHKNIVCFGIGNMCKADSRYQLALLRLLSHKNTSIYDPYTTVPEYDYYINECRFNREVVEDCKKEISEPTLFYMLHCETWMYLAVIEANKDHLEKIQILGNSFLDLDLACSRQVKLPRFPVYSPFNSTCLMMFDETMKK